jgi:hypothetical protein
VKSKEGWTDTEFCVDKLGVAEFVDEIVRHPTSNKIESNFWIVDKIQNQTCKCEEALFMLVSFMRGSRLFGSFASLIISSTLTP